MIPRFTCKTALIILHLFLQTNACNFSVANPQSGHSGNNQALQADTVTLNRLNREAFEFRRSKPDTAFYLANKALKYSLEIDYKKGVANAYMALGYIHLMNYSKNDSAYIYLNKAYDVFKQTGDYFGMGMVCFGMAYIFSFKGDLKESEKYLHKCLELFNQSDNMRGLYNAYNSLAYIYQQYSEYEKAYDYIKHAIDIANKTGDTALIADARNSQGNILKDQYLFRQAIDVYFKALNLWEQINDSNGMSLAYGNIGLMYYYQNDFNKALEYYKKKLPVSIKTKDLWEESRTYNDIGYVYLSISQYDTALMYYKKGLKINQIMNYLPGIADSYSNLANIYLLKNCYDSARHYIILSIDMGEKTSHKASLAGSYVLLGKIFRAMHNNQQALTNILKGYEIAKRQNIPDIINETSEILSRIYSEMNRYDLAYKYLTEHKLMQDSISQDENIKKITQLEMQYGFDKKQRKMMYDQEQERIAHQAELRQQRILLNGSLILIFFIILFGILVIRQKNLRAKLKNIDLEQKLLRVQMNPHFIFNSLCAVQDYILNNKSGEANAFLSKFAALIRAILETSRQDFVILEKEIQSLKNYIEIQKLRFETDLDYSFEIDDKIDTHTVAIPPMLSQPFVENAIEHGLRPKKEKGFIAIRYHLENGLIRVMIEDNGIGRKQSEALKSGGYPRKQSLATRLTEERIKYLKKSANRKVGFNIEDITGEPYDTGTRVIFRIPYRNENI